MTLRECFEAMQEPYKTAAHGEIDNEQLLNSEVGKISHAVKHLILPGIRDWRFDFWTAYYNTLIKMGL